MQIESYAQFATAFARAFPDADPPPYREVRTLDLDALLRAIATVQADPLSKFNADKASLLMRLLVPRVSGRRVSRRAIYKPRFPRRPA